MNKKGFILVYIGIFLICSSFVLQMYNTYQNRNAGIIANKTYKEITKTLLKVNDDIDTNSITIDGNDYIGTILIPTLGLELPIMSDWDNEKMKIAPCRYYGSIYTNDLVLCSHSYDNLLGNIKDLNISDLVVITDIKKEHYIYKVEVIEVLGPDDVTEMIESDFDLTLYTCTKDNLNRVTVRLNRV